MTIIRTFVSALLTLALVTPAFADTAIDWSSEKRVGFRGKEMMMCRVLLATPEEGRVSDSVATPLFNGSSPAEFRKGVEQALAEKGAEFFEGSTLYVTGVGMREEKKFKRAYEEILEDLNLTSRHIKVKVLSLPKKPLEKNFRTAVRQFFDHLIYFFPSLKRDYEAPTFMEVLSGFITTGGLEGLNLVYLYKWSGLPLLETNLIAGMHTVTIGLYTFFKKFMTNWLLRSYNGGELLLKQMSMSMPFIVNYNVLSQYTPIMTFLQTHTWAQAAAQFPAQAGAFLTTQGLTTILQTVFYSVVVNLGFRAWENSQVGERNYNDARSASNFALMPILAIDSVAMTMASATGAPIYQFGVFEINMGHLALAGLATVGSIVYFKPQTLDPALRIYQRAARILGRKDDPSEAL